jgi:hypothetical protein
MKNMTVTIETTIDIDRVLLTFLRNTDLVTFLQVVRDVVERDAVPAGVEGSTAKSNRCYGAVMMLDDVLDEV